MARLLRGCGSVVNAMGSRARARACVCVCVCVEEDERKDPGRDAPHLELENERLPECNEGWYPAHGLGEEQRVG